MICLQLLPEAILLGPVIYDRPYDASKDVSDSYQVFQAALLVPGGLGVVAWDSEDHAANCRSPSGKARRVFEAFVCYDRCGLGIKALLLPHVDDLLDQFLELVTPCQSSQSD